MHCLNKVVASLDDSNGASKLLLKLFACVNEVCPKEIRIAPALESFIHSSGDKIAAAVNCLSQAPDEVWQDEFTIGYAYQFLSMKGRRTAQANIQTANKELAKLDLIAFTQLYTPRWVVDFLLANCALPQLDTPIQEAIPEAYQRWRVNAEHSESVCTQTASDLTILDPACGAGNFLVRALDFSINSHLLAGLSAEEAVSAAQANNIYGVDIDVAALWITCLSLLIKCFQFTDQPPKGYFNLSIAGGDSDEDLLGSLSQKFQHAHALSRKYSVVLMNPPYIGRKLMSRQLKAALKKDYPDSYSDISAAFVERALQLLSTGGRLGMITQASILTLPSYGNLRRKFLTDYNLVCCADAGSGVFPLQGGDKVNSAIIVIENEKKKSDIHTGSNPGTKKSSTSKFFDLRSYKNKSDELLVQLVSARNSENGPHFNHDPKIFLEEHENAIRYGCPAALLKLLRQVPTLDEFADVRQGLATSDNERFIKRLEDVPEKLVGSTWIPYVKGAGADRWFSPIRHVVKWENDGKEIKEAVSAAYPYLKGNIKWVVKNEQFYFRAGLCFSFVNTGNLAVRKLPAGCIFDVGASALFANNVDEEDFLLAYLNSSLIAAIAKSMNPTINFQVGDIKRLPMFPFNAEQRMQLSEISKRCQGLAMQVHAKSESLVAIGVKEEAAIGVNEKAAIGAKEESEKSDGAIRHELAALEQQNDGIVLNAFMNSFNLREAEQTEIANWVYRSSGRAN